MINFAHAGEVHETATQAASHSLLENWYIAVPLFVLVIFGVGAITYLLSKKSKPATFIVVVFSLFVIGLITYKVSAPVSVIALTVGFAAVLIQVLANLGKKH